MNTEFEKRPGKGKKWVGIALLILGMIMLTQTLGVFPKWLTSFPMVLIAAGVITGANNQFKKPISIILLVLGGAFLLGEIVPNLDLSDFIFPGLLVGVGVYLLLGRKRLSGTTFGQKPLMDDLSWDKRVDEEGKPAAEQPPFSQYQSTDPGFAGFAYEDYLDVVSVFGNVRKNVVTKNFKGGEIVTVMGGAEINLSQADILSRIVVIDVTQIFGGTKIIVPPHWKVSSELAAVFGGIEDKRFLAGTPVSEEKHLIIKGTSIFGGIDIRSF